MMETFSVITPFKIYLFWTK